MVNAQQDRADRIRRLIPREALGIEIGPWLNPLCAKATGYNVLIADIFDQDRLRSRAANELGQPPERVDAIEFVDFVGSVSNLDEAVAARGLTGQFDYVISSHNFEHIPDPIRFLQACSRVLKPGGVLSMALPDRRTGGDYFRPYTTTAEILAAFWEKRVKPSPAQILQHVAFGALHAGLNDQAEWRTDTDTSLVRPLDTLAEGYRIAIDHVDNAQEPYFDAHCWVFTPASFELILLDLQALNLIEMSIDSVVSTGAWEFYAHLANAGGPTFDINSSDFSARRKHLLHQIVEESGSPTS